MFKPGDYIYSKENETYYLLKVLVVERLGDHAIQHCLVFKPSKVRPTQENIGEFEVSVMHSPFSLDESEQVFVVNRPVTEEELYGYRVYMDL